MFSLSNGIQTFLMDVITTKHKEAQDMECFLAFDEMALKERWVYEYLLGILEELSAEDLRVHKADFSLVLDGTVFILLFSSW